MKVVTYATHSFGTFEKIIENQYGVQVDVIGFGTKWKGFMDKIQGVYNYCYSLPDDEIVVFIDGFDSEILRTLDGLEKVFNTFNCKLLLSKEASNLPKLIQFANSRIFGTCKNKIQANSGMYMGYVKYLKIFLKRVLEEKSNDDQRNFNLVCNQFDWLEVDVENKIFFNRLFFKNKNPPADSYFLSTPGTISLSRAYRIIIEYYQFFIREISLFILIVSLILFMWRV